MKSQEYKFSLKALILWLLPIWGYCASFCYELMATGFQYSRIISLMTIGMSGLILSGVIVLMILLCKFNWMQKITALLSIGLFIFITYSLIIINFEGYRLAFGMMVWILSFSIFYLIRNLTNLRIHKHLLIKDILRELTQLIKNHIVLASILTIFLSSSILMMLTPFYDLTTHNFTITDEQAQDTDIVFYYAGGANAYQNKEDLLDVCVDYNVTLSLAWHIDYYNDTDPNTLGYEMANFSRLANAKGVKLEFFPCFHFNWEGILDGYFFTNVNLTLDWYEYWTAFKSWLDRELVDVDYVLWDIEGGTIPSDVQESGVNDIFNQRIMGIAQRERELPLIRAEFEKIIGETIDLGAKTRITTWDPLDGLDGDHDMQLFGGQIGYVFEDLIQNETIEYVSSMSYTNRWGDMHPDDMFGRGRVYENSRIARSIHPNHVGICIGNINGRGLTTIEDVVDEYRLAIAGGATSVRLFNGASWVLGWNYIDQGPEWGANGTRALFEQCRNGGSTQYTENRNATSYEWGYLLADVSLNFFKI